MLRRHSTPCQRRHVEPIRATARCRGRRRDHQAPQPFSLCSDCSRHILGIKTWMPWARRLCSTNTNIPRCVYLQKYWARADLMLTCYTVGVSGADEASLRARCSHRDAPLSENQHSTEIGDRPLVLIRCSAGVIRTMIVINIWVCVRVKYNTLPINFSFITILTLNDLEWLLTDNIKMTKTRLGQYRKF